VGLSRRRVSFTGSLGHELRGQLELPDGDTLGCALFAPCFTCPKDAKAIVRASRALAEHGVTVLRYDVTGTGESGGSFAETSFTSQVEDLEAAADYLRNHHRAPRLVVGISLGGAVVLAGSRRVPEVAAVATINTPADTVHLRDLLVRRAPQLLTEGSAEVLLFGAIDRSDHLMLDRPEAADFVGRVLGVWAREYG